MNVKPGWCGHFAIGGIVIVWCKNNYKHVYIKGKAKNVENPIIEIKVQMIKDLENDPKQNKQKKNNSSNNNTKQVISDMINFRIEHTFTECTYTSWFSWKIEIHIWSWFFRHLLQYFQKFERVFRLKYIKISIS